MNRMTEEFLRLHLTPRRVPARRPAKPARAGAQLVPERLSRPVFLERAQRERIHRDLTGLYDLLLELPGRLAGGDTARYGRMLGLTEAQAEAARRTARPGTLRLARPDLYECADGGFRVMEMNITAALGGTGISWQSRMHLADPAVRAFVADEGVSCVDTATLISRVVLAAWREAGGSGQPVLAVAESPAGLAADPTSPEYVAMRFQEGGIDAIVCDATLMRRRDGGLWVNGRRVDIVYRMFLIEELRTQAEAAPFEELLMAQERGEVMMLMPLDAEGYGGKAGLAVLSDDRHRHALSESEVALVDRVLPWTRGLDRPKLVADGVPEDTLEYVLAHREELILKPSWLHGGVGVLPGWTTEPREWRERVASALGGPYVVQRRVVPVTEPFRNEDGSLSPWVVNWGVFLVGDEFGGIEARAERADGDQAVISQGNGASVGCCFSA